MRSEFVDEIEQMIPTLRRFAHSLARNAADADDLLQDTLERSLGRSHQFEAGTNLKAWLFTIMRNRFYTECRRRQRVRDHADERRFGAADGEERVMGDQFARVETQEVARAFGMLTGEERSLLIMATVEELPYETIAQMLEVEIGTVKSRVSRVRAKLRRIQEETGDIALARVGLPSKPVRTYLSAGTA
ncbi:Sigma-24 (FecI) [alpha proteobacterium BAL199]|jgi:RNA polymerase sigma-70 factor, ECF subfamily|nr:Sigma-24 (FecI) [alpha proteobacterium BAL199]